MGKTNGNPIIDQTYGQLSRKYRNEIAEIDDFKNSMSQDPAARDWAYQEMSDIYAKHGGTFVSRKEFDAAWGAMTEEQAAQKKLDEAKAANSEAEKVVEGQKKKEPTPVGSSGSGGSSVDPKIEKTANKAADAAFLQQKEKLAREYPEFAADKSLSPEDWRNAIQYDKELNGLIDVVQSGGTISDVQKLQKKLSQKGDDGERTYNPLLSSTVAHANKVMTGWNWKFVLSQADGAIKNAQKQAEDALKQYQESGASEAQIQKAKQEMDIELKDFADKVKKDANMKILKMGVADPFTNFEAELEIRRESLATADRWLKKAEQFRRIGETEGWSAADGKSSQAEINYNQAVFNAMASHPKAMVLYDTEEYKPHLILNPTPDKMVMYMYMANKKAKNPELSWQDVQKDALYFMNEYLPNLNPYQRQAYMTTMEDDFNRRMVTEDELQVTLNAMGYDLDLTKDRHVANAFMRGLVDMGGQGLKGLATASDPAAAGASINILGGGGVQGSTWGLLNHPKYGFNTLNQASREEWQMQQDLVNGKISRSAYDKWYSEKMKVYGNKGMVNKGIYSGIELMENPRLANKVMQSPLYIAGQSIQDWSKDTYRFKPKFADSFWMTTLPEGGGSLVGFAGVGAMARVMGVSPMVAASVFGSFVNMGQVYDDAIQHGATEQEALQATMTGGIAGGSVEGVEMAVLFNFLTKKIPAGQVLGTIMYRMAVSGVVEGVQEGLTDVINNMTARQIYDFSRDIINDQTIDSISAGFVLGMMLGPLTAIAGGSEEDQKLREEAIDNISRKIDEISEQQDEMPNSSQFVNQTKEEDGIEDAGTGEEESAAPGADEGGTDEAEAGTGENAGEGETGAVEGDGADAADGGAEEKTSENAADEGEAGAGEEATEETSADVDSMAKALKEFGPIEVEEKTGFQFDKWSDNDFKTISEAYHKAKADGSNPELVKAVEDLLSDKSNPKVTEIESKKADIERRRQEELKERVIYDRKPTIEDGEFRIIGDPNRQIYRINENTGRLQVRDRESGLWTVEGTHGKIELETAQRSGFEKLKENINAKYDAELKALEQQPTTSNQSEIETKKADIERRRQEELDSKTPIKFETAEADTKSGRVRFSIKTYKDGSIIIEPLGEVENGVFHRIINWFKPERIKSLNDKTRFNQDADGNYASINFENFKTIKDDFTDKQSLVIKEAKEKIINAKYDAELAALGNNPLNKSIEAKKADIERRRKEELLGETFTKTTEKIVTSKGPSNGKTVIRKVKSKISSDGEVLTITPTAEFKEGGGVTTTPETMTLKEFKEQFYEKMSEEDKDFFDEIFEGIEDTERIKLKEARIGLKGVYKGHVNIDVETLEGRPFGFRINNDKEINAKYDAELAALEGAKPAETTPISDKKADIERRREEELAKFRDRLNNELQEIESNKKEYPRTVPVNAKGEKMFGGTSIYENAIKTADENFEYAKSQINAKYDAELADVEKSDPDLEKIDPLITAARNGDIEAQKQLEKFGLPWEQTTTYRFTGQSEIDVLLSGEKVESKREYADAGIDVTSNPKVTTAADSEYRVTFKESFDKNNGLGKVRAKNEEDSNLERGRGYDLNDVAKIERLDENGNVVEVIYSPLAKKETTTPSNQSVEQSTETVEAVEAEEVQPEKVEAPGLTAEGIDSMVAAGIISKKEGLQAKEHLKNPGNRINKAAYDKALAAWKPEEAPAEAKEKVFTYNKDGEIVEAEVIQRGDNTSSVAIDGKHTTRANTEIFATKEEAQKRADAADEAEKAEKPEPSKMNVVDVPIADLNYMREFQNRDSEGDNTYKGVVYSSQSVDKMRAGFDMAKMDPIWLWKNPKDGKLYVLSGHSRSTFFRMQADEGASGFDKIPAKIFEGISKEEALKLAIESNTLASKETDVERSKVYRKMREQGKSKTAILEAAKLAEGANAQKIIDISYLNPTGKIMTALNQFGQSQSDQVENVVQIARWGGKLRAGYEQMTNAHEDELFDFLLKNPRYTNYDQVRAVVDKAVNNLMFDPAQPMNLQRFISKSTYQQEFDADVAEKEKAIKDLEKNIEAKRKRYINEGLDTQSITEMLSNDMALLNKLRTELVQFKQKGEANVKNAENSTIGLFDDLPIQKPEPKETEAPAEWDKNLFKARTYAADLLKADPAMQPYMDKMDWTDLDSIVAGINKYLAKEPVVEPAKADPKKIGLSVRFADNYLGTAKGMKGVIESVNTDGTYNINLGKNAGGQVMRKKNVPADYLEETAFELSDLTKSRDAVIPDKKEAPEETPAEEAQPEPEPDTSKGDKLAELERLGNEKLAAFRKMLKDKGKLGIISDPKKEAEDNAELIEALVELAEIFVQLGYYKFKAWAEKIVSELGEVVREYLEEAWDSYTDQEDAEGNLLKVSEFAALKQKEEPELEVTPEETPVRPQPKSQEDPATSGSTSAGVGGRIVGNGLTGVGTRKNARRGAMLIETGDIDLGTPEKRRAANLKAEQIIEAVESGEKVELTADDVRALMAYSGRGNISSYSTGTEYEHYTPLEVYQRVYGVLSDMGFLDKVGSILIPGVGMGRELMAMPASLHDKMDSGDLETVIVDLPQSVGLKVAKLLFPKTRAFAQYKDPVTRVSTPGLMGFKKAHGDKKFDLIITNVPFDANARMSDMALHDGFIAESLDLLAPGGYGVFIAPTGVADKVKGAQSIFATKADVVTAIRLPSNTFKDSASTTVDADLLIFRKPTNTEAVISGFVNELGRDLPAVAVAQDVINTSDSALARKMVEGKFNVTNYKKFQSLAVKLNMAEEELFPIVSTFAKLRQNREDFLKSEVRRVPLAYHEPNSQEWFRKANVFLKGLVERKGDERLKRAFFEQGEGQIISMDAIVPLWDLIQEDIKSKITETVTAADATNINPAYSLIAGTWQVEDILGPLSTAIQHLIHGLVNYDISNRILEGKSTKPHIITNLNQLIEGQHLTPHHTFRGPKVFGSEIDMGPESTRLQEMQEMRFMPDSELNKKVHIKKVGDFMVKPADNVQPGTHIVIHGEQGDVLGRKSNVTPDRLTNMLYAGFEKEFGADSAKKLRGVKGSISIEGLMANSDYRVTKKKQSRKEKLGESFEQMRRKQIMTMLKGVTDNLNQQVKMANYIEAVLGSVTGSFYKEVAGTPELMDLLQTVDKILEYRDRANNNQLSDHEQSIARKAAVGELQEFILRNGLESLSKSDLVKQLAATDEFKADARSYAITSIANLVEDEDGKLMKPDFWEGLFGDKKVRYDEQQEFTSAVDLTNTIASREGLPKSFAVDHLIERIRASKLRLNPELAERLNDEYEFTKALTATGEYMMDVTRRDALHVMATEDFAVGNIIEKIAFATEALDQMIGEGVDPINLDAAVAKLNELRASIPPIELKDVSLDPNAGVVHSLPDIIYGFADLMMGGDMRSAIVQKQIGSTVRWEFIGQSDNNLITEALSANGKSITRGMFARWMNRTDEVKPMEGPQQGTFVGTDGKITSDPEKAKKIPDPETTTERNRVLTEKFNEFVKDHGLADQVKENYNNQFAYYEKKHSTGEMELRGLSKTFNGKPLKINPWQWKAVHHYMEYGRSFFNHAVGAGKTMTAVLAAKAKMDKGLSKTAGFLVPLKTVQQWQDTWQQLFPDLRVVVVTSQNREQLFSDISFGGADVVIMPGSIIAPSRATLSPDKLVEYMHQDLEPFYDAQTNLTAAMNHAELAGDKAAVKKYKKLVNDNQRKINSKLKVIESIMERSSGQVQTTLDSIGIDQLIVDEADVFKNLETPLGDFSDIKGISTSSSGPAEIVRYWTRYTQDQTNYNNIAYLTATPVSNSAVELYQSMNAIIPDSLESAGIRSLDDFLTEFADVISEEMAGQNGKMQIKKVFAGVKNTVALRRLMKQCYDVISQEQMDEQMLAQGKHLPKAVPMEHTLPASSARTMANYLQMGWAQIVKDKAKRSPAEKKAEQVMMQYVKDRMNNIDATLKKAAKENWAKKDIDELKEEYRKLDVYRKKESFGVLSLYNQMRVGIASTKYFSKFLDDSNSPSGKLKYAAKQAADSFMRGRGIIESGQYESVETDEFGNRFVYIGNNEETGMPMYRSIDGGQIFFADRLRSADLPKQSISNDFFAALKEELSARGVEVDDRWFGTIDKSTSKSLSEAQVSKYLSKYIEDADQLKDAVNFIMTEAAESIEIQKDEQGFDVYDEDGNPVYDIESGKPTLRNTIKYLYNTGRIKFLFGSTEAMGVGMNLQYNTTDIHHIDMPQRPRDYVQRNGRSVRQGNKNFDVNVHSYTTQGGPEIIMLQLLKVKDRFISSLFNFNDEETSSDTGEVGDDKMSVLTKQLENLISNTTDTRVSGYVQLKKQLDRTVQGIKDARRATETLSTAFGEAEKLTQNLAVKQKRIQILESVRDWFNQKIDQQEANDKGFKKAYQEWESQNGRKERLTQLNKDLDSGLIDLEKYKDERTKLMETAPKREMVEITAEDMQQLIDDYQMPDFTPSLVSNLAYELLYPGELNTVSYTQNSSEVVRGNKELQSLFSKGYKHKRIVGEKEWGESPEPTQRMTTTIQRLRNLVSRDLGSSKNEIPGVEKRLEYAKRMISGDIQAKVQALVDKLGKDDMILDKDLGPFAEKATEPQSTLYDQLEQLKKKEAADRPLFEAFIERQMQYSLSAVYHIESVFPDHSPEKVNDLVEAWVRNMFQHDKMVTEAQGEPVPEMPFLKADGEGPGAEVVTQEEVEGILGLKGVDYTEAGSTEDLDDDDGAADIWASEAEDINNEETRATYGSGENYENPTYNTGDVEIEGEVEGEKTTLPTEAALESVINRIRKLYPSLDIVVTDAIPEGANPVFFQNGSMHINPALIDADGMVSQLATMWLAIFRGFNPAGYNQISQIYREENDGADLDESVVFQEIADAVAAGKEPTGFEKVWQWIKNFLAGIFGYFPVDISKMTVKQFANLAARELWTGKGVADIRANGVASALLNTKGAFAKFQRSRLMPSGERFSTEYGPDSVVANMNGLKVRLSDVSRRLIEGMTYQVGGGVRLGYKGLRILGRTHLGHFIESNRQVRIKGNLTAIQTIAQEIGHAYDMAVAKFTDTLYFHVKNDGKVEIEQPGDSGLNPGDMKSLREVNKMNKKLQRAGRTMATYKNVVDANLAAIGKQLIGWDAARVESSKGYSNLDIEGKIKEAIAEFVSEYVVGEHPVPVQSLMFYDMFENQLEMMASQGSPEYRNALRSARVEYQVYKAMPALWRQMTNLNTIKDGDLYSVETKSVMSQWLQKGKNVIGYARKKQLQYEIAMTDDAFVMKHLHYSLKAIGKAPKKESAALKEIQKNINYYIRALYGTYGMANAMLHKPFRRRVVHGIPQLPRSTGERSLHDVISDFNDDGLLNSFESYLMAKRQLVYADRGMLQEDGRAASGEYIQSLREAVADFEALAGRRRAREGAEAVYQFQAHGLQYLVDSGLKTQDEMDRMMILNPFYVPIAADKHVDTAPAEFYGGTSEDLDLRTNDPLRNIKPLDIKDMDKWESPMDMIAKNMVRQIHAANKGLMNWNTVEYLHEIQKMIPDMGDNWIQRVPETDVVMDGYDIHYEDGVEVDRTPRFRRKHVDPSVKEKAVVIRVINKDAYTKGGQKKTGGGTNTLEVVELDEFGQPVLDEDGNEVMTTMQVTKPTYYQVPAELFELINFGHQYNLPIPQLARMAGELLRNGAINMNPVFSFLRNPFRDFSSATYNVESKIPYNAVDLFRALAKNIVDAATTDETMTPLEWLTSASGADLSSSVYGSSFRENIVREAQKGLLRKGWDGANPVGEDFILRRAARWSDSINRHGAFLKLYREGADVRDMVAAFREASGDYAVGGKIPKAVAALYPFMKIQVWFARKARYILTDAAKDPRKLGRFAAVSMMWMGLEMACWVAMQQGFPGEDDKDRERRRTRYRNSQPWLKYVTMGVPLPGGGIMFLPKSTFQMWLGSSMTFALEKAQGADPGFTYKNLRTMMADQHFYISTSKDENGLRYGFYNMVPHVARPVLEGLSNYNTFQRRPIVPYYMDKLDKQAQYYDSTPYVYRQLGLRFDISPLVLQHLVESYTATVGRFAGKVFSAWLFDQVNDYDYSEGSAWRQVVVPNMLSEAYDHLGRNSYPVSKAYDLFDKVETAQSTFDKEYESYLEYVLDSPVRNDQVESQYVASMLKTLKDPYVRLALFFKAKQISTGDKIGINGQWVTDSNLKSIKDSIAAGASLEDIDISLGSSGWLKGSGGVEGVLKNGFAIIKEFQRSPDPEMRAWAKQQEVEITKLFADFYAGVTVELEKMKADENYVPYDDSGLLKGAMLEPLKKLQEQVQRMDDFQVKQHGDNP